LALMEVDPDDASLLSAFSAGNAQAFARLYDRYDPACFLFVRRMLTGREVEAAEDVHQDTWLSIARNARSFDPAKGAFRTWLFTIARRKVWDHLRRQKVAVLAAVIDEAAAIPDPGVTPEEHTMSREMAERLITALEALPLAQRETFVLFTQAGLSLEEISIATDVGLETAKSRLRYARTTMRSALAAEGRGHV